MTDIVVRDATAERWPDLEQVMGTRGDPSWCWCQFFRMRSAEWRHCSRDTNRQAMRAQLDSTPPGVLAYRDDQPVGWCAVAPRSSYVRLAGTTVARSAVAAATEDAPGVWSVTCFVVQVTARRAGVASTLLAGAVDLARRHGATVVEAYPVDTAARSRVSAAELYHGPFSVFRGAGFSEVARPLPARPVVRLELR